MAAILPWDQMAAVYAATLQENVGRECVDIRIVLAAIIIKHKLGLSDRETVEMISENVYMQYFAGYSCFSSRHPFDASLLVDIRKRLGNEAFDKMNVSIIQLADSAGSKKSKTKSKTRPKCLDQKENNNTPGPPTGKAITHRGKLKLDATVCDQMIEYPTDLKLLNQSRLESERIIDQLYKKSGLEEKPRTYRRIANKGYMAIAKKRKNTKKAIRKAIRKQLGYLRRNLAHIDESLDYFEAKPFPLNHRDQKILWVINLIYDQQKTMYDTQTHSHDHRIVNIYQPYVRPIVRGKDKAKVEFGLKIGVSEHDGFSRINQSSWEAYNESTDLIGQVTDYRTLKGCWPEIVLADRIYLNRGNRKWLTEKNIKITGRPLGRPPKEKLSAYQKSKQRKINNERNHIEGKFGQAKNGYGLSRIRAKRSDTSQSWVAAIFWVMNIVRLNKIMPINPIILFMILMNWGIVFLLQIKTAFLRAIPRKTMSYSHNTEYYKMTAF